MLGEARRAGLVAMSLEHLFGLIAQNSDRYYLLKLSMLEIYNEVINDLLEPGSTNLVLREDAAKGQVMVAGVKNVEVRLLNICHEAISLQFVILCCLGIDFLSSASTRAGSLGRACTLVSGNR